MAYLTASFADAAPGPYSIAQLFSGETLAGVTILPAAPATPPRIAKRLILQNQSDTAILLVGTDSSMEPSAGGGVGLYAEPNASPVTFEDVPLDGIFISFSEANGVVGVIAQGGFQ